MFRDLALILPLGLAAASSPTMLTEQTVLLAGQDGRRIATTRIAPGPAERALDRLGNLISQYGRTTAVVLIAALGIVLVGRGALHVLA